MEEFDESEAMLMRADQLARDRGYFQKSQAELLTLARETARRFYKAARAANRAFTGLTGVPAGATADSLLEHGKTAMSDSDLLQLEYYAAIAPLSHEARRAQMKEMVDELGPGWIVGA